MAEHSKLPFHGMDVRVEGTLEKQEGGFRFTRIVLRPSVSIDKQEDLERTQRLIVKAEKACLVSRSLASEIGIEPEIKVEEALAAAK